MNISLEKYIEGVKEQLECNATDEYKSKFIVYSYTNEQVDSNLYYFQRCKDKNLSPYKALLFFSDELNRELCDCGKVAVWCYLPGFSNGDNPHFCDDCVPRGCTCNYIHVDVNAYYPPLENPDMPTEEDEPVKWIEEGKVWCHLDEKGREYPCCEYTHEEEGWSKNLYEED